MRNGEIVHKFYLGQTVKTTYKNQEYTGRILEIKIRSRGNGKPYQKQVLDEQATVSYRIEGIIGNVLEFNVSAYET